MVILKTVSAIFASSLFLFSSALMAEGQADRQNEGDIKSGVSAILVIDHINKSYGATAAGGQVVDTKMTGHFNALQVKFSGVKHKHQYKNMTAIEFRKELFGSN